MQTAYVCIEYQFNGMDSLRLFVSSEPFVAVATVLAVLPILVALAISDILFFAVPAASFWSRGLVSCATESFLGRRVNVQQSHLNQPINQSVNQSVSYKWQSAIYNSTRLYHLYTFSKETLR